MACVTISNDRERCQDPYHSNPFSWPDGERGRSRHDSYPIRESGEEKANNARPPELNIIPMGPLWGGPDPDGAPSRRSGHECVPEPLDPARRPIADVLGFVFPDGVRSRRWVRLSRWRPQPPLGSSFPGNPKPSLGSFSPTAQEAVVGFVFPARVDRRRRWVRLSGRGGPGRIGLDSGRIGFVFPGGSPVRPGRDPAAGTGFVFPGRFAAVPVRSGGGGPRSPRIPGRAVPEGPGLA